MSKLKQTLAGSMALSVMVGCSNSNYFSKMPTPPPTGLTASLQSFRPALAVRGASCILCHAQVKGNMVTDFGYGDPYFLGTGEGANPAVPFVDSGGVNWFGNPVNAWQSATIHGQVYIPDATLPYEIKRAQPSSYYQPQAVTLFSAGGSLFDLMTTPYVTGDRDSDEYNQYLTGYSLGPVPEPSPRKNQAMTIGILPDSADLKPLVTRKSVSIKAPPTSEIMRLYQQTGSDPILVGAGVLGDGSANFTVAGSAPYQVVTHSSSSLKCYGDVVINGPLLLNQTSIETDAGGCRLYVSGSVFIRGPIYYSGDQNSSNLQITSSRAILLGIFYDPDPTSDNYNIYKGRLAAQSVRDGQVRANLPDYGSLIGDFLPPSGVIASDGLVGRILSDAVSVYNTFGSLPEGGEADGANPPGVQFSHLLLNAPMIQSRYLGHFKGTIISELALFRLGQFRYEYDSLFDVTPALPALETLILSVSTN